MGRDRTFDDLVSAHLGAVRAFARALTADPGLAEEAVQETLVRAWRYLDSYQRKGSFEGWLLAICRNCVIDLTSRQQRLPVPAEIDERGEEAHGSAELFDLIARLPLPQREVLVLCGWLGYDYADAAVLIGVPVGTVRSRLARARVRLAELVADSAADDLRPSRARAAGSGPTRRSEVG